MQCPRPAEPMQEQARAGLWVGFVLLSPFLASPPSPCGPWGFLWTLCGRGLALLELQGRASWAHGAGASGYCRGPWSAAPLPSSAASAGPRGRGEGPSRGRGPGLAASLPCGAEPGLAFPCAPQSSGTRACAVPCIPGQWRRCQPLPGTGRDRVWARPLPRQATARSVLIWDTRQPCPRLRQQRLITAICWA